jgi:hypothetical protein
MLGQQEIIQINKDGWNKVADQFFESSFDILHYKNLY